MTVREARAWAVRELEAHGVPSPHADAEWLLASILRRSRTALYAEPDRSLVDGELDAFRRLVERRSGREPLAYILGEWGFRRLTLRVDPRVLIPRPETEIVVESCLARLSALSEPDVLDVGTGSGAIALAIADEHPGARVVAFDSSPDALAVARANLEAAGLGERVRLVEHDLTAGFGVSAFDLVVSNPPYVRADEIDALEPEVRDWEPRGALVGEGALEAVAVAAREALRPGGWLVLEVGDGQARRVAAALGALGYSSVAVNADLAGRERVVEGSWPGVDADSH